MSDEPDNVVPIGKAREPALTVRGGPERPCGHGKYMVHEKSRVITCKRCKCELDPFTVIRLIADDWKVLDDDIRRLQAEKSWAQKRLDELRKQEANAKARLRRIEAKLARGGQ